MKRRPFPVFGTLKVLALAGAVIAFVVGCPDVGWITGR